ncbi:hypothetical protein SDC9_87875 [bioreactor metagenome]|uniref:Preprotein translocase subunit SecB n=1 Tax=bioreactor metagenome TaxID=1076179 RepID=A0A644ZK04_9ZZZZ
MENNNISFKIETIELLDYSLSGKDKNIPVEAVFNFDINIEHRFDVQNNRVIAITNFKILVEGIEDVLGSASISCIYNISEMKKYIDGKDVNLPDEFITTINSLSLSTSRGILFTLFRGTILHNAILPVINPLDFKKEGK